MRTLSCVLCCLLVLYSASCAYGFQRLKTRAGLELFWPKAAMPVPYEIPAAGTPDVPGTQEFAAIQASFDTWQQASNGKITFRPTSNTYKPPTSNDHLNTVGYWVHWDWTFLTGGASQDVIALTLILWNDATGEILEADILCNNEFFKWGIKGEPYRMDVQAVMTHEVGHFLGLGEEQSNPAATMFPRIAHGETLKRTLSLDDIIGVRTVYADASVEFATRLYSVVLGRDPDPAGFFSWINFLDATGDFEGAVKGFLLSPEFLARADNSQFVRTLYQTALFREPDPEGFAFNLHLVNSGAVSLEGLIDAFLGSPEFQYSHPFP